MKKLKFFSRFVFGLSLVLISFKSKGEVGCALTDDPRGRIYIEASIWFGQNSSYSTLRKYLTYRESLTPKNTCDDFYKGTPTFGAKGTCKLFTWPSKIEDGHLVTYALNCPIDDYIPLILVAIGGVGFIFIRKRFTLG